MPALPFTLPPGWTCIARNPGDGITRYAFFHNAPDDQTYFGPFTPSFIALGRKEASAFAAGLNATHYIKE